MNFVSGTDFLRHLHEVVNDLQNYHQTLEQIESLDSVRLRKMRTTY
jgi:hypothetical protein